MDRAWGTNVDEALLACSTAHGLLRWDNVETCPVWHTGAALRKDHASGWHVADMKSGGFVTLRLKAGQALRVASPSGPMRAAHYRAWISNGSGLYRPLLSGITECEGSIVIVPEIFDEHLVRVECQSPSAACCPVGFFVSRIETPPPAWSYAVACAGPGQPLRLCVDGVAENNTYHALSPAHPWTLTVAGPCRVRLRMRYRYDQRDSQTRQAFDVQVAMSPGNAGVIELETNVDQRHLLTLNGCPTPLSREETAYWNVPAGQHLLTLSSTADLIMCAEVAHGIRRDPEDAALVSFNSPWDQYTTLWAIPADQPSLLAPHITAWPVAARTALRSARDNRFVQGGNTAWRLLRRLAIECSAHDEPQRAAEQMFDAHHHFRTLLPIAVDPGVSLRSAYFSTPQLASIDHGCRPWVLASQHIDDSLRSVILGRFIRLDGHAEVQLPLIRDLPLSRLRVALATGDRASCTRFDIQFNARDPIPFCYLPNDVAANLGRCPTLALASLTAIQRRHPSAGFGPLSGPFAVQRSVAPWVDAVTAELQIPAECQYVRVRSNQAEPQWICIQQSDSSPYTMSESSWLRCTDVLPIDEILLAQLIQRAQRSTPLGAAAFEEMRNQTEPLIAALESAHQAFSQGVQPREERSAGLASNEMIETWIAEARRAMERREPATAIERWSRVADATTGQLRCDAIVNRIQALLLADEFYLAEQELKGRILFDGQIEVRRASQQMLEERYRESGRLAELERLQATMALTDPTPANLTRLAATWLERGNADLALSALRIVPPNECDPELLLRAATQAEWWRTFDAALARLGTTEAARYWSGYRALRLGNVARAHQEFAQGGAAGLEAERQLVAADEILQGLRSDDHDVRATALATWTTSQNTCEGRFIWKSENDRIVVAAGVERVRSTKREAISTYYRARPQQPVLMDVQGPVTLRLEARPLHPIDSTTALNDWLLVTGMGRRWVIPIRDNQPSTGLLLDTDPAHRPGQLVTGEWSIGPGRHTLEITAEHTDVLLQLLAHRPECPLPLLPPLTPEVVLAAQAAPIHQALPLLGRNRDGQTVPFTFQLTTSTADRRPAAIPMLKPGNTFAISEATTASVPMEPADVGHGPIATIDAVARALYEQRWDDVAASVAGGGRIERRMNAHALCYLAEKNPSYRQQALSRLVELANVDPTDTEVRDVMQQLEEQGDWVTFREVQTSAGLRSLASTGPRPHYASAQVRYAWAKSLDANIPDADCLLMGYEAWRIRWNHQQASTLQMQLFPLRLGYLRTAPHVVVVHVDGQPAAEITVDPQQSSQTVTIPLPAGSHQLEMRLQQPYAGQYVGIHFVEVLPDGAMRPWESIEPPGAAEQLYYVATPKAPVTLGLRGPALVKVEEWSGGSLTSRRMTITSGQHTITLQAQPNGEESYYRVLEHVFLDNHTKRPPLYAMTQPVAPQEESLPTPWLQVADPDPALASAATWAKNRWGGNSRIALASYKASDEPAVGWQKADPFRLGGQEDGTVGVSASAVTRRPVDEGPQGKKPDEYLQTSVRYDEFQESLDRYVSTEALLRVRESSGPTFGMIHERWDRLENSPLGWLLRSAGCDDFETCPTLDETRFQQTYAAYVQRPSDPVANLDADTEASFHARFRLYRTEDWGPCVTRTRSLTWFGRWLSQDELAYAPGHVDQDVFTLYKATHRLGLQFSELWTWDRSPTARWWARPMVVTNEDHNLIRPDHISLQTGYSALTGNLQWDLSYRLTRYLEDADRDTATWQHVVQLDTTLDHWQHAGQRYQLDVRLQHILDQGQTSAFLTLTRYTSQGRGYRDQPPGDVSFRRERERRAFPQWAQSE